MTLPSPATTTELARLIDSGRAQEALDLCERMCAEGAGGGYYAFWRDRLLLENKAFKAAAGSPLAARMRNDLVSAFKPHGYAVHDEALPDAAALEEVRAALVAQSPFKGDIYLPTAKLPLNEQVRGLRRVAQLVQADNMQVSARRFALLKEWVQARGTKRVFVIGNGPSLKKTDLSLLRNEITIGFNGIFLHEDFAPTIYVVEDHLVAEDRVSEILAYRCPVKIFPSYLGYCIDPQDNTIFLNHRPRISYPVDTDFSADAGRICYTGGTVTYTGLQIAASLGVEEIVLIGVDASYKVHNVERSETYGTGVLTSKEDDTNHFDPRYFGKGYRWHDPNVHTMLQAYRKAREYGRDNGVRIVNAGIGGELEVFPRFDYYRLFAVERVFPRLAVLDFTSVNRLSATGIVKRNLLAGYQRASQLHVYADEKSRLIAFQNVPHDLYAPGSDEDVVWPAFRSLVEFDPQVLYLRPTLDRVPMTILQAVAAAALGKPWIVHYMDDWLEKARSVRSPEVAAAYHELMQWFFRGATQVLSICPKMSEHLVVEFGLQPGRVHSVHNMMPAWAPGPAERQGSSGQAVRVIRYFGGLEPDMGLSTVVDIARQVEQLNNRQAGGGALRFEIITGGHAAARHATTFAAFPSTALLPQHEDYGAYLQALASSDLNLICYNFDEASLGYVRYSLANKLPELIACGVPFLAVGHEQIGTIELLRDAGCPLLATSPDFQLGPLLEQAFAPSAEQLQAWRDSVAALREEFSDENNRGRFHRLVRSAAALADAPAKAMPLGALKVLLQASGASLKHSRDLDVLLALPALPLGVLAAALARARSHGREWSVREEQVVLGKSIKDARAVATGGPDLQARAVAFLIASLGHERYDAVNQTVRSWLRTLAQAVNGGQR